MKILHISHHVGCIRDHAYIYRELGADFTFWKFPKGLFHITKEIADQMWNEKKEYFNTFDYVVTSDTAPLSRIFMENLQTFRGKLVVWICNRFDYNMEKDPSFYEIFRKCSGKVQIIPYSDFEGIWCQLRGIPPIYNTITPIGKNPRALDSRIDCLQELSDSYTKDANSKEAYGSPEDLMGKYFIPIYGNDNCFFNMRQLLQNYGIPCFNGGYSHPEDLKACIAMITFPDAFSKLITFETIQNEVVVFLPSRAFLCSLHPTSRNGVGYWFNSPVGHLNPELIGYCEWYRYENCRIYFDSIEDLLFKLKTLSGTILEEKKRWCRIYGAEIERTSMQAWKQVFS